VIDCVPSSGRDKNRCDSVAVMISVMRDNEHPLLVIYADCAAPWLPPRCLAGVLFYDPPRGNALPRGGGA